MKKSLAPLLFLSAAVLVLASPPAAAGLLESMPAGSDVYLAFDPGAVGMERFLEALASSPVVRDGDMEQLRGILGFDPMDWASWTGALALDPEGEIGLQIDAGEFDVTFVALYLPSSDPSAVDRFFHDVFDEADGFHGILELRRSGDHTVVLIAEDPEGAAAFDPSGPSLGDDPEFEALAGGDTDGNRLGAVYADLSTVTAGEDLRSVLITASTDEERLLLGLSARAVDPDIARLTAMLSPSPGNASFGVPGGTDGTLRLCVDMAALDSLLGESGITAEYDAEAASLGLMPAGDLLGLFSGETLLTLSASGGGYATILQIGLEDPDGAEDLLRFVKTLMDGTGGGSITGFDLAGTSCYRIDAPILPWSGTIEYGIFGGTLVLAAGCSLRDPSGSEEYGDWIADRGIGLEPDAAALLTATPGVLRWTLGNESALLRGLSGPAGSLDIVAASLEAEGDLLSLRASLVPTDGDPARLVNRILTVLAGILFR